MAGTAQRILVTGGAGLIGRAVAERLLALGHAVRLFDLPGALARLGADVLPGAERCAGSILDTEAIDAAAAGCGGLIHLAARLGVRRTEDDPLACLWINIEGTRRVLDAAVAGGVSKVVFASSSEVYGEPPTNPITEQTPTQGKTVYAVTKLAGEEYCKAYGHRHGLRWTALRYFNCYGPGQVAQFVVPRFVRQVQLGQPPRVFGTGQQMRSYTYSADVAEATARALLRESTDGAVINVGSDRDAVNLRELAQLVIEVGEREGDLKPDVAQGFDDADRGEGREIFFRYCRPDLAAALLDWRPTVTLEEGLRRVFAAGMVDEDWPAEDTDERPLAR